MTNQTGFDDNVRKKYWHEVISTVTKLDKSHGEKYGRKTVILQFFQQTSLTQVLVYQVNNSSHSMTHD